MRTIKIAFYKNSKTAFGSLIRFKQRHLMKLPDRYARYSHTEILFEDGMAFSSSEYDGGVRFKKINWKSSHWDFLELEVSNKDYDKVYKFCKKQDGNAYNWWGIVFSQALGLNWFRKKGDYFCSEIVSRALQEICFLCIYDSVFISPGKLAYILEKGEHIIS